MPHEVKTEPTIDLRAARIARTEAALLDAARELFLEQGYVPTTLAQIAARAGVATRTVYVRFGTKVALFRRVIDRALVGDDEPVDVAHRPRTQEAMTAPTLPQRLAAFIDVTVGIMQRAGHLFDVAAQAEGLEPELAAAWQAGRQASAELCDTFWSRAADDGMLPDNADTRLLGITTDVLICADTVVHLRRTRSWTAADYRSWLEVTLPALVSG